MGDFLYLAGQQIPEVFVHALGLRNKGVTMRTMNFSLIILEITTISGCATTGDRTDLKCLTQRLVNSY